MTQGELSERVLELVDRGGGRLAQELVHTGSGRVVREGGGTLEGVHASEQKLSQGRRKGASEGERLNEKRWGGSN